MDKNLVRRSQFAQHFSIKVTSFAKTAIARLTREVLSNFRFEVATIVGHLLIERA